MKIFRNKFFIIILSIAVFLTIFTATLSLMGQTDPIKNVINKVASPFRNAAAAVSESIEGFKSYFRAIEDYKIENDKLHEEIGSLENSLADRDAVIAENERLREYLGMKEKYSSFSFCEALIVGREGEGATTFLTLNKGKNDGVDVGMSVMSGDGLVGSVCESGDTWSRVRLLNEASASAGAYITRSGEIGVICGDIAFKGTRNCTLKYLPEDADIAEGDTVFTSGEGSVYQKDIYIGRVINVESDVFSRTKTATVECAVDLESLKYVLVVTGSEGEEK